MVYPTKDAGVAIGEIIAKVSAEVNVRGLDIRLSQDELVVSVQLQDVCQKSKKPDKRTAEAGTRRKYRSVISCGDKSMTVKQWAEHLGLSCSAIRNRIKRNGNPLGLKGPSSKDKLIAASAQA